MTQKILNDKRGKTRGSSLEISVSLVRTPESEAIVYATLYQYLILSADDNPFFLDNPPDKI